MKGLRLVSLSLSFRSMHEIFKNLFSLSFIRNFDGMVVLFESITFQLKVIIKYGFVVKKVTSESNKIDQCFINYKEMYFNRVFFSVFIVCKSIYISEWNVEICVPRINL